MDNVGKKASQVRGSMMCDCFALKLMTPSKICSLREEDGKQGREYYQERSERIQIPESVGVGRAY
jgi:hypothetical protein